MSVSNLPLAKEHAGAVVVFVNNEDVVENVALVVRNLACRQRRRLLRAACPACAQAHLSTLWQACSTRPSPESQTKLYQLRICHSRSPISGGAFRLAAALASPGRRSSWRERQ
jgi:hypothetical protein